MSRILIVGNKDLTIDEIYSYIENKFLELKRDAQRKPNEFSHFTISSIMLKGLGKERYDFAYSHWAYMREWIMDFNSCLIRENELYYYFYVEYDSIRAPYLVKINRRNGMIEFSIDSYEYYNIEEI